MQRILIAFLAVTLAGCGGARSEAAAAVGRDRAEQFATLLEGFEYDFDVLSPVEQREAADVVVLGVVSDVAEGRTLSIARGLPHANLVVRVDKAIKGATVGDVLYVEVPIPTGTSWTDLRAAAPVDRVLLFLDDRTDQRAAGAERGRPSGARVFAPFVQGLIVEAGNDWASGLVARAEMGEAWTVLKTFEAVVSAAE